MKRVLVTVLALVALVGSAGCGGSDSSTSSAADGGGAAGSQTPEQAAAQSLQKMLEQGAAGQTAKAVDYELLKGLLPEVAGWERSDVKGDQGEMMGMSYSRAEGDYNKGDANVRLEITDTALIQSMVLPFSMLAAGGFNQRSDEGFKRGTTVGGSPGWEEWEHQTKSAEVNVLVAGRFIVRASGHDLQNIEVAKEIVQAVPVAKLAALK
jgi:hypothetical protein